MKRGDRCPLSNAGAMPIDAVSRAVAGPAAPAAKSAALSRSSRTVALANRALARDAAGHALRIVVSHRRPEKRRSTHPFEKE